MYGQYVILFSDIHPNKPSSRSNSVKDSYTILGYTEKLG